MRVIRNAYKDGRCGYMVTRWDDMSDGWKETDVGRCEKKHGHLGDCRAKGHDDTWHK